MRNETGRSHKYENEEDGRWERRWFIILKCLPVIRVRSGTKVSWKYSSERSEWEERKGPKNSKASLCYLFEWSQFSSALSTVYYKVHMCLVLITI